MPWLLKRILTNGLAAAAALALLGLVFTEVAQTWLNVGTANRPSAAAANAPVADALRSRLPLTMAVWGFGLVAVSEGLLYAVRGGPPKPKSPPKELKLETAEVLVDELLRQTDQIRSQESGARSPRAEGTGTSPSLSIHA
jgi:hypothetical protein